MKLPTLDPQRVPLGVASLIPLAERWGIGDDLERDDAVRTASPEELQVLATCLSSVDSDALFAWLEGPESYASDPSAEYVALTCLTMAIDKAKMLLKKRASSLGA